MDLGSEGLEVEVFRIWTEVQPISGQTGSKFGLFGGVRKGSKFGFGGQTWVQVSSNFDPVKVPYIWVRSNAKSYLHYF